jgi:AcrR family transcriptional regulator
VGDIAERAMINRATFYRHYQDKYDLVATIFEEAANHLVEDMKPLHKDTGPGEKGENLLEIWNQLFEHVAELCESSSICEKREDRDRLQLKITFLSVPSSAPDSRKSRESRRVLGFTL